MVSNSSNYSSILSGISWEYVFNDLADSRSTNLLFMKNPIAACTIVIVYLYFVLNWGPKFMKSRRPFQMDNIVMIYNLIQIAANFTIFVLFVRVWKTYNWICQPTDNSNSDFALMAVRVSHMFFLNKICDLADTIFFVLRKKQSQITFLHLWHHASMVLMMWFGVKYLPTGHGSSVGLINSFIHVLLYIYYFLTSLGPKIQKYLWWKKYLTVLQLVQFGIIFAHYMLIFMPSCSYPKWITVIAIPYVVGFYVLFMDFYTNAYTSKLKKD